MEITIYDNGGKSWDRYTVIIKEGKWFDVYGMSENASEPDGFNQYNSSNEELNKRAIGKKVLFNNVPMQVRKCIVERIINSDQ